ncbi:MAG: hypothetical protein K9L28_04835 [Synergistales bacterium]|nr:hypothetical protein [Synergistales bacterium]
MVTRTDSRKRVYRGIEGRPPCLAVLMLCLFVLTTTLAGAARAEDGARVACMTFKVNGVEAFLGDSVAEVLQASLIKRSSVEIVERSQFAQYAKELELQTSAMTDEATVTELGKVSGASYLILGSINSFGSLLLLNAKLVRVEDSVIVDSFEVDTNQGVEGLLAATREVARAICSSLEDHGIAACTGRAVPTPTEAPVPTPTEAPVPTPTPLPRPTARPTPTPRPRPTATPAPSYTTAQVQAMVETGRKLYRQKDYAEAYQYFKKASSLGSADGTAWLATCYYRGHGTARHFDRAINLLRQAEGGGSDWAKSLLFEIDPEKFSQYRSFYAKFHELAPGQSPQQKREIAALMTAARNGYPEKQYLLAERYYNGNGLQKDYQKALHWYQQAAGKGFGRAMFRLGYMYESGRGVAENLGKAAFWYRKAAGKGVPWAMKNLGALYETGRGVPRDYNKALMWYKRARDHNCPGAAEKVRALQEKM